MARSLAEWIGSSPDAKVPPRVKLRVWEREQGKCHRCCRKIPVGDAWIIEHRLALVLGGANAESNLCLSCSWCKPIKDAEDVKAKADTARVRSKHLGIRTPSKMRSRGFEKRPKQHTASRPLIRRSGQ